MRGLDETPLDPEMLAALDAIDATLAGEAVDPDHAEFAELALLLADERPRVEPAFAVRSTSGSSGGSLLRSPRVVRGGRACGRRRRGWRRAWLWWRGRGVGGRWAVRAPGRWCLARPRRRCTGRAPGRVISRRGARLPLRRQRACSTVAAGSAAPAAPQPAPTARKTIQAAQLSLSTAPGRVDAVAQEVFDVVGRQNGVVSNSNVTSGATSGYAQFQLSIPSGSLPQTMSALSSLQYAQVSSRTDTTQDVNDQYQADVRRLADARALRTSLLKQLANATTQSQIDSLGARIHDAEASISSDEATLRQLSHQVGFSQVTLTISAGSTPIGASPGSSGFTFGKAAHDAGRVLTVAAGVVLIAAAALVPLALIAALAWWIATLVRRRRREQALDAI